MRIDEIEARKAEIKTMLAGDTSALNIDSLLEEVRGLEKERTEIEERNKKEAELRENVSAKVINDIKKEERKMENIEIRNSKEYINAYANYIKTGNDKECRALLTDTVVSGTVPTPELVYELVRHAWDREGIVSRVKKAYIKGTLKIGIEVSATTAAVHTEGAAGVSEETLVLATVNILPKSIKKWISVSDEALDLAGEEFLRYIYDELAYQIAKTAAGQLIASIEACTASSVTDHPAVDSVNTAIGMDTVAQAIAHLTDEAANPVIMMNKLTYAEFKRVQYANGYGADPFEGLPVEFNNSITAYSAATTSTSAATYMIVGDLGAGAIANFPSGEEINFKFDDITLATSDLVKIVGREYVGIGVIAPNHFVKVQTNAASQG